MERFEGHHAADYRLDLPLAQLRPGEHLLTLTVGSGKRLVRRDMRFHVESPTSDGPSIVRVLAPSAGKRVH